MSETNRPIYLDYQATTPVDPRVLEAMLPFFTEEFGNPASTSHIYGSLAQRAVEDAREELANAIGGRPQEITFTSGATEAINLAIKGVASANQSKGRHFITAATEHKAVLDCFDWLERNGYDTTILLPESSGLIPVQAIADAIRPDTVMVSIMAANNEIGVIQPLKETGEICRDRGVYFMTDATQAFATQEIAVGGMNIDLLVASGHKIYGPKGIGMLWARRSNPRVRIDALIHGGGHERGLRSGTLPVPGIVGFGRAAAIARASRSSDLNHLRSLRDRLMERLVSEISEASINGTMESRLPGNLNISLPGVDAEALISSLRSDLAISTGSACTSAQVTTSHVLTAIGLTDNAARSSLRFSIGRFTTSEQIEHAALLVAAAHERLIAFSC